MKHIHVELGKDSYDIHIENGLLDPGWRLYSQFDEIADPGCHYRFDVDALYWAAIGNGPDRAGFRVHRLVFPAGESRTAQRPSSTSISSFLTPALPAAIVS